MAKRYSWYKVSFRYISGGKVKKETVKLDALNMEDAKRRVIKGEKPKIIAVDKVVKTTPK